MCLTATPVIYTFGIVILFMLFFGYLVGGPFFHFLVVAFCVVVLYGIYRLAKGSKGSALLNFFGILYMFVASLSLIIYFYWSPSLEVVVEDLPLVVISLFLLIMGTLLKFVQNRAILTVTLFIHGGLTIFLFTVSEEVTTQVFLVGMLGIIVDVLLLIYVNIMKGLVKEVDFFK